MKKKIITKAMIMRVYALTIDTQPFYETKGKSHFGRMVEWFELNEYNITNNSVNNICKYIANKTEVREQILHSLNTINKKTKWYE